MMITTIWFLKNDQGCVLDSIEKQSHRAAVRYFNKIWNTKNCTVEQVIV
jgi:hypothetical protein